MSRLEKIAFIKVNLENLSGEDLDNYSDMELDALIKNIVHAIHLKDLGIQRMKDIFVFLN